MWIILNGLKMHKKTLKLINYSNAIYMDPSGVVIWIGFVLCFNEVYSVIKKYIIFLKKE
jgi:hypothetical protein